jgi:Nif-specific regulatory protein
MTAKLVSMSGPLKGHVFPLEEKMTIGRDPSSTVHISDVAISRNHCVINQGKLFDLDSLNGTFVNGVPVKERVLQPGDRIDVGGSQLLFLTEDEEAHPMELTEDHELHSTIFLKKDELPTDALWKFSMEIHRIRNSSELKLKLMQFLFEAIPADRGAIVFAENSIEEFSSVFAWDRVEREHAKVRVSRTIANLVLTRGESILTNDASRNFDNAKSLAESGIVSVLASPFFISQKVQGFIYLESARTAIFSEQDLKVLASMSAIASVAFENLRHLEWLVEENQNIRGGIAGDSSILGESPKIKEVLRFIDKASATDSTVVITGESGTGKELVARALHDRSSRAGKPFVAINCAALTESLLESELFGHEKGAFTGAIAQKKGKFEIADGGTVFLDEVTELSPTLQAKLLRVLQEREFERVGGTHSIRVDIRVLAATNRNWKDVVKEGKFREDLYYRLNVLHISVPPLRERAGDIALLATYFASSFGIRFQKRIVGISPEARSRLMNYHWPGNVRELENAIEHAVVLGNSESILPEDLPESLLESAPAGDLSKYHEGVRHTKKQLILNAVDNAGGNLTAAAKLLGVHPNYLHRLIRNLDLRELLKKE